MCNVNNDVVVERLKALNALLSTAAETFTAAETSAALEALFGKQGADLVREQLARAVSVSLDALSRGVGAIDVQAIARYEARAEIARATRAAEAAEAETQTARRVRAEGKLKGDLARRHAARRAR